MNIPRNPRPKASDYAALADLIDSVGYDKASRMLAELMIDRADRMKAYGPSEAEPMLRAVAKDIKKAVSMTANAIDGV